MYQNLCLLPIVERRVCAPVELVYESEDQDPFKNLTDPEHLQKEEQNLTVNSALRSLVHHAVAHIESDSTSRSFKKASADHVQIRNRIR